MIASLKFIIPCDLVEAKEEDEENYAVAFEAQVTALERKSGSYHL